MPSWPGGNLGLLTQLQSNLHGLEEHTNVTQVCRKRGATHALVRILL